MAMDYFEAKDFIEKCHYFEEDLVRKQDEIRKAHMLYLRLIDDASKHHEYLSSVLANHERNSPKSVEDIEVNDQAFVKDIFEQTQPLTLESPECIDPADTFLSDACSKFLYYLTSLFDTLRKPGNFANPGRLKEDIHHYFQKQMRNVDLHYKQVIDKLNEELNNDETRRLLEELDSQDERLEELNTRLCDLELENEELNYQLTMYENGNEIKTLKEELKRKDLQVSKLQFKLQMEKVEKEPDNKEFACNENDRDSVIVKVVDSSSHIPPNDIEMITETHEVIPGTSNIEVGAVDEKTEFTCSGCCRKFFSKKRLKIHVGKNFVPDGRWFKCAHSVPSSRKENNKVEPVVSLPRIPSPQMPSAKQMNDCKSSTSETNVADECVESSDTCADDERMEIKHKILFRNNTRISNKEDPSEAMKNNPHELMVVLPSLLLDEVELEKLMSGNSVALDENTKNLNFSNSIKNENGEGIFPSLPTLICKSEPVDEVSECISELCEVSYSTAEFPESIAVNEQSVHNEFLAKTFLSTKTQIMSQNSFVNGWTCLICGEMFPYEYHLKLHLRWHNKEKLYFCQICNRAFLCKSNMKQHLVVHRAEWPFECKTCGKVFKRKHSLKLHLSKHSEERPYECQFCGKAYKHNTSLRYHIQRLHNSDSERPFVCTICGNSFRWSILLKQHITSKHTKNESVSLQPQFCFGITNSVVNTELEYPHRESIQFQDFNSSANISHVLRNIRNEHNYCIV